MNLDSTYDREWNINGTFYETDYYVWADFGYKFDGQIFIKKGSM